MLMVCTKMRNNTMIICMYIYVSFVIAGAMRIPDKPDSSEKMHYLTDFYAETEFGLKLLPFNNSDDNTWLKFYDEDKIKIKGA